MVGKAEWGSMTAIEWALWILASFWAVETICLMLAYATVWLIGDRPFFAARRQAVARP